MTSAADPEPGVDLAHEPDFVLAGLSVSPSASRVRGPGGEQRVEPRVMQVLIVLIRHAGHTVTRDQLIDACWDGRIVSDDAVARVVAQVRQLARSVEPAPYVLETVPKVGFRLLPSDADDAAPAALPAPRSTSFPPGRIALVAAGLAVLLAVVVSLIWWRSQAGSGAERPVVAVLPFDDHIGGDGGREIADGVPGEIINTLVRTHAADVRSSVSSFRFRGPDKAAAAGALKARYVLDGSVEQQGQRIIVEARLTDASRNLTVWSDAYDRPTTDLLATQQDIAANVADAVKVQVSPDWRRAAQELPPDAYRLYVHAHNAIRARRDTNLQLAITDLEQVVGAAPRFGRAWSALAVARALRIAQGGAPPGLEAAAEAAARRALEIDPKNAEALGVLGLLHASKHEWLQAGRLYDQALVYEPNEANVVMWKGNLERSVGLLTDSAADHRRAFELDPLNMAALGNFLADAQASGDTKTVAMLSARHALLRTPAPPSVNQQFQFAVNHGDWATGARLVRENLDPQAAVQDRAVLATIDAILAHRPASPELVATLVSFAGRERDDLWVRLLIGLGEYKAAAAAAVAVSPGYVSRTLDAFGPAYARLRRDPAFMTLAAHYGYVDYWQATGRWPNYCSDSSLPYDCKVEAARARQAALIAAHR